ncbi:ATP-dependent zinc protease family protein [Marinobacter sp. DUT-1]|uniref:ATP-dependent zinc protease family protein n=1 Tax=Marinobacter sp. DUT-1 TaxID=3412037 RepID=UPI003D16CD2B
MGYKRSRAGFPLLFVIAAAVLSLALAGCSSNRYFMVPKKDLTELNSSVQSQRATLVTMEGNAAVRHEQLLQREELSTQTILEAIEKKVEKPVCPPTPPKPVCPTLEDTGRADRLKGKVVVGEVEKLYLAEPGLVYTARIDSGAETSSMDARNITRFERDGNNWVRFDVPVPGTDELVTMEKEISRRVRIIQASAEDSERRVVVELQFAIGDHKQVAEFTLADRSNLTYEVLIGRNVLRDVMLIDVGKEFATELPKKLKRNGDDA